MASAAISVLRGATSCLLFVLFGLGSLAITPAMLALRHPERCQPVVRAAWRIAVWCFVNTGLVRVDFGEAVHRPHGMVFVANHPSLIDVVLFCALVPQTLYVAKGGLRKNPFLAAIVRATSLPDDARLPEAAAPYLARGWNVLVFPEGTRSPVGNPAEGGNSLPLNPFRRGAAQLALRTAAPLVAVGISPSRRILAKGQAPWDMGNSRVTYRIRLGSAFAACCLGGESVHAAARRVTAVLETLVKELAA